MKYVVQKDQQVKINGIINRSSDTTYNNYYENEKIEITEDFLKFEHTDGLNYINLEIRRFDRIFTYQNIHLSLSEGLGVGFLFPKTNTTLLNNERYDQFHLSGYGLNSVLALNLSYKIYFIQSEIKGGFINMPDIRTTNSTTDKASQYFFFSQINFLVGVTFRWDKNQKN